MFMYPVTLTRDEANGGFVVTFYHVRHRKDIYRK